MPMQPSAMRGAAAMRGATATRGDVAIQGGVEPEPWDSCMPQSCSPVGARTCGFLAKSVAEKSRASARPRRYVTTMDPLVELPVSLPALRAVRGTTTSLHTGVKEHHGVGRIEHGDTEWWGA